MVLAACIGGYFVLFYTIRGREVVVPNVISMTQDEARAAAAKHDLALEISGSRVEPRIAEGRVFDQIPQAGARTRPGRALRVYVSLGQGSLEVPGLVGAPLRKAQVALDQAGLRTGRISYVTSPDQPSDGVLAQNPAVGARRQKGDAVDLLVSRGPQGRVYVMPSLAGLTLDRATALLADVNVRVGVTRRSETGQPSGQVVGQRPEEGFPLREREAVQLVVAE